VAYQASEGRRVNVVGAYFSHGPARGTFLFASLAHLPRRRMRQTKTQRTQAEKQGLQPAEVGALDSERLLEFLWRVAGRPEEAPANWRRERPLVIVLDNYSVHKSALIRQALPSLTAADVYLFYLPPYTPELSRIEPLWHAVKHHELPQRSFSRLGDLKRAVDTALTNKATALWATYHKTDHSLTKAA
jgi:hypothetical protein